MNATSATPSSRSFLPFGSVSGRFPSNDLSVTSHCDHPNPAEVSGRSAQLRRTPFIRFGVSPGMGNRSDSRSGKRVNYRGTAKAETLCLRGQRPRMTPLSVAVGRSGASPGAGLRARRRASTNCIVPLRPAVPNSRYMRHIPDSLPETEGSGDQMPERRRTWDWSAARLSSRSLLGPISKGSPKAKSSRQRRPRE